MDIKIIRSERRARTVTVRQVGSTIEVLAPAHLSDSELEPIVARLIARLERRNERQALDDADLVRIATSLNQRHFGGKLSWTSLQWSTEQQRRFGSCTPANRSIRISTRLAQMPRFVLEYVIMHELAHLVEANHGPRFWQLVARYPLSERARGYLMAIGLEDLDEQA
ncbi:MAG: M48 family metallopeptidase [Oscillochloridaceae bacterium umkhey_bin13]